MTLWSEVERENREYAEDVRNPLRARGGSAVIAGVAARNLGRVSGDNPFTDPVLRRKWAFGFGAPRPAGRLIPRATSAHYSAPED